jgi:hypothetical protein
MVSEDSKNWSFDYTTRRGPGNIIYRLTAVDSVGSKYVTENRTVTLTGDEQPILIRDLTSKSIPMGDDIVITVELSDSGWMERVWALFYFAYEMPIEANMTLIGPGRWSAAIPFPFKSGPVQYRVNYRTIWGKNHGVGVCEGEIALTDNELPYFIEVTAPEVLTTGEVFLFTCKAKDNIMVKEVFLGVRFGTVTSWFGTSIRTLANDTYNLFMEVPHNATLLVYQFKIVDLAGNIRVSKERSLRIMDNDPPEIRIRDISAGTGERIDYPVLILEGIGIESATLNYTSPGGRLVTVELEEERSEQDYLYYTGRIWLPSNWTGYLPITVTAVDRSGNIDTAEGQIKVYDDEEPTIIQKDLIFKACEEFTIDLDVNDNVGIMEVEWEGLPVSSRTDILKCRIMERGIYHVKVSVEDTSGNRAESEFIVVIESPDEVEDDDTGWYVSLLIGSLVILCLIGVIIHLNEQRNDYKKRALALEGRKLRSFSGPNRQDDRSKGNR